MAVRVTALDDIEIVSRAKGGDGRTVTAYAAVFGQPAEIQDRDGHYHEQIAPGAFAAGLRDRRWPVIVTYNHAKTLAGTPSDLGSVPIGRPIDIREDSKGLLTVTRYNSGDYADQILGAIQAGSLTGMSFTGQFQRSEPEPPYIRGRDGRLPLVTRRQINLLEYGPTPIPAYPDAKVVDVRTGQYGSRAADTIRAPDPERAWTPRERAAYLAEIGVHSESVARYLRTEHKDQERYGQVAELTELEQIAAAWDDGADRCPWCRTGWPWIQAPGRSYYICASCWESETADIRDRRSVAELRARTAAAELAEISAVWGWR